MDADTTASEFMQKLRLAHSRNRGGLAERHVFARVQSGCHLQTQPIRGHLQSPQVRASDKPLIVDVGTGTGCIILSLARELKDGVFVGLDVSADALALARENAAFTELEGRVVFAESDGCGEFDPASVDLLVYNPPYIPSRVVDGLAPHIREHEPRLALDGGPDGLNVFRALLLDAVMVLKPGGGVFFEIGDEQGPAMRDMLEEYGFMDVAIVKDYSGRDRFATGVQSV